MYWNPEKLLVVVSCFVNSLNEQLIMTEIRRRNPLPVTDDTHFSFQERTHTMNAHCKLSEASGLYTVGTIHCEVLLHEYYENEWKLYMNIMLYHSSLSFQWHLCGSISQHIRPVNLCANCYVPWLWKIHSRVFYFPIKPKNCNRITSQRHLFIIQHFKEHIWISYTRFKLS